MIPFFGKINRVIYGRTPLSMGPKLATSPSSFHLSLVISLLCMDLARIMDDFSRPLYSWRTPVLGPPDIVANLTGSRKLSSPPLRRPFNLPLFYAFPFSFWKVLQVDNFLVIRSALGNPGGSPVKCISISVIAIDRGDTRVATKSL